MATVAEVNILEDTEAYKTLEENLRKIGFDNATNNSGQKLRHIPVGFALVLASVASCYALWFVFLLIRRGPKWL